MTEPTDRRAHDPFAPASAAAAVASAASPAAFPEQRLTRAGLDPDVVQDAREHWEAMSDQRRAEFVALVDGVDDSDLADDGAYGGRLSDFLERGEAADVPDEGDRSSTEYDPTAETVAEVEAHLRSVSDAAEVRRIADREKRVGDDRKGVAAAAERRLAELGGQD